MMTFTRKPALLRIERIKAKMDRANGGMDMTFVQVGNAVHMTKQAAWVYMKHLHALQEVHICGWDDSSPGPHRPIYRLGPGVDAPDRPALSWAEHSKNRRARINADPEAKDLDLAKKRAWYHRRKAEKTPNPLGILAQPQGETLQERYKA